MYGIFFFLHLSFIFYYVLSSPSDLISDLFFNKTPLSISLHPPQNSILYLSPSTTIFHFSAFNNFSNSFQEFLKTQSEGRMSSIQTHWISGWVQGSLCLTCFSPSVNGRLYFCHFQPLLPVTYSTYDFNHQCSSTFSLTFFHIHCNFLICPHVRHIINKYQHPIRISTAG